MNKVKEKILKRIAELEKSKANLKEFEEKAKKEADNKFEEDLKFINAVNPFYKKKHSLRSDTSIMLTHILIESGIESEIKTLKELLEGDKE